MVLKDIITEFQCFSLLWRPQISEFKVCLRVAPVAGDNKRARARDHPRSYIYFSRSFHVKTGKFGGEIHPASRTCTPLDMSKNPCLNLVWSKQADLGGGSEIWTHLADMHIAQLRFGAQEEHRIGTQIWQKQTKLALFWHLSETIDQWLMAILDSKEADLKTNYPFHDQRANGKKFGALY